MRTTMIRVPTVLSLFIALVLAAACSDSGSAKVTAIWQYDEARTVARAEGGGAALKAKLAAMVIDLQFRSDNTYSLKITGGPEPTSAEGTFKSSFGGMVLLKTVVDGKLVTPTELHVKSPERGTMELTMAGNTIILKRR